MKAYLYQWTHLDTDFYDARLLGKLGGGGKSAGLFKAIEKSLRSSPQQPHWVVAARRDNWSWSVFALLKVRLPTDLEADHDKFLEDKFLYFDEDESGFLARPNEPPMHIKSIDAALNAALPQAITYGENGKQFEIDAHTVEQLKRQTKLTIAGRRRELAADATSLNEPAPVFQSKREDALGPVAPRNAALVPDSLPPEFATHTISPEDEYELNKQMEGLDSSARDAVVKVRIGQGKFRAGLVNLYGPKCWMSDIEGAQVLTASHIRPWSQCDANPDARGNIHNGLLLSAFWDAVFDSGLITFGSDWRVLISDDLSQSAKNALWATGRENRSLPERFRSQERAEYLTYHRSHVFERWKKSPG